MEAERTLSEAEEVELFELLPVATQQAVARGEVNLADLLERATRPDVQLCPFCCVNEITPDTVAGRRGICVPCAKKRLTEGRREVVAELDAHRENVTQRKAVQRLRDVLDPDRKRRAGPWSKTSADYGRHFGNTLEPLPLVHCEICGRQIRQHTAGQVLCIDCEEHRDSSRTV